MMHIIYILTGLFLIGIQIHVVLTEPKLDLARSVLLFIVMSAIIFFLANSYVEFVRLICNLPIAGK